MQTSRAQVISLVGEAVDGAAEADFSEDFEAVIGGAGVDFTSAEEGAEAIIMAGAETTEETGGTLTTEGDSQTDFGGGVRANIKKAQKWSFHELLSSILANSPSKWGHDLFDEISKDEEVPAKENKEVESADVTAMDE